MLEVGDRYRYGGRRRTIIHVAVKGRFDHRAFGTRAGFEEEVWWRIQKGKTRRRRMLRVRSEAVRGEWMDLRSAEMML